MGEFLHRANGILKGKLDAIGVNFETWDMYATQLRFDWGWGMLLASKSSTQTALRTECFDIGITG